MRIRLSDRRVLTINTGSSSLKAVLYAAGGTPSPVLKAHVAGIGGAGSRTRISDADGAVLFERKEALADHAAGFRVVFDWLAQHGAAETFAAAGHRIVHGGLRYREPQWVTPELTDALRAMAPLNPDHLPQAIGGIEMVTRHFPALPQAVCLDTTFHRDMPRRAQMYALPRHLYDEGIRHFGFHGLSYEYVVDALRQLEPKLAGGRIIVAHLGSGASMAAIDAGRSIDTSMGYTPASGLVMGTRCGDVDPGVPLGLIETNGMTAAAVNDLINRRSGLLGVSGVSADMRELLNEAADDLRAAEAVEMFCYRARKYVGAYAAALGGLDGLVFTGGIGERAAGIRERICAGLAFLGIELDAARNRAGAPVISTGRVSVRVIETDENLMIARHTIELMNG